MALVEGPVRHLSHDQTSGYARGKTQHCPAAHERRRSGGHPPYATPPSRRAARSSGCVRDSANARGTPRQADIQWAGSIDGSRRRALRRLQQTWRRPTPVVAMRSLSRGGYSTCRWNSTNILRTRRQRLRRHRPCGRFAPPGSPEAQPPAVRSSSRSASTPRRRTCTSDTPCSSAR